LLPSYAGSDKKKTRQQSQHSMPYEVMITEFAKKYFVKLIEKVIDPELFLH